MKKVLRTLFSIVLAVLLWIGLCLSFNIVKDFNVWLKWMFIYTSLLLSWHFFIPPNKFRQSVRQVLFYPLLLVGKCGYFLLPAASIFLTSTILVFIGAAPVLLLFLYVLKQPVTEALTTYLQITIITISMSIFGDFFVKKTIGKLFKTDKVLFERTALFLLDQKKTKAIVYGLYFIYLFINYTCLLNHYELPISNEKRNAILYSFATFIAFERMYSNRGLFVNKRNIVFIRSNYRTLSKKYFPKRKNSKKESSVNP